MHISIITLFPEMFSGAFEASIIKRAISKKLLDIRFIQLRNYASDSYGSVDDHPYGGGTGMILRVDIVDKAITSTRLPRDNHPEKKFTEQVILLDPQGIPYV